MPESLEGVHAGTQPIQYRLVGIGDVHFAARPQRDVAEHVTTGYDGEIPASLDAPGARVDPEQRGDAAVGGGVALHLRNPRGGRPDRSPRRVQSDSEHRADVRRTRWPQRVHRAVRLDASNGAPPHAREVEVTRARIVIHALGPE